MERDYFKETLPEYRTPKAATGVVHHENHSSWVSLFLCSNDNSMDQDQWFFAVQVVHCEKDDPSRVLKTEVHFYLDERDAWLFRAKQMGSDKVHFVDYQQVLTQEGRVAEVGTIREQDFRDRSVWDGHTLQEIRNLKA